MIPTATPIASAPPTPMPSLPESELSGALGPGAFTVRLSVGGVKTRGGGGDNLDIDDGGDELGVELEGEGVG